MKKKIILLLKKIYWKLPINSHTKENLRSLYADRKEINEENIINKLKISGRALKDDYIVDVLKIPERKSEHYKEYYEYENVSKSKESIYIAYYLTQYHPNKQNDEWWGKGVTEWTNVSKAVPQFVGHDQPKLPGELGFYDLRIKDNMLRQIDLAKNYGIDVFCYYYYWFNGDRLLEKPLNMFLEDENMNMPFCICWANENWTRRFSGTNVGILMKINESTKSCKQFIHDIIDVIKDSRYFCINERPVILVYRPSLIQDPQLVLGYWRSEAIKSTSKNIYIIAVQEKDAETNWTEFGFDAETEFQPKQLINFSKEITAEIKPIRADFEGNVYDYEDIVENTRYNKVNHMLKKVYKAAMPAWDNTARRNQRGTIFHKSSPQLYKKWLIDITKKTVLNEHLDAPLVFINAWNEWGEGAYLEPDRYYGYAYLQATREAKDSVNVNKSLSRSCKTL